MKEKHRKTKTEKNRGTEAIVKGCELNDFVVEDTICYIFPSFFFKYKQEHIKLGKEFFISLEKLFPFSRKSNFRILHFQISWHHQMPKHKTRNTFH